MILLAIIEDENNNDNKYFSINPIVFALARALQLLAFTDHKPITILYIDVMHNK